jgi:hypothetical protein
VCILDWYSTPLNTRNTPPKPGFSPTILTGLLSLPLVAHDVILVLTGDEHLTRSNRPPVSLVLSTTALIVASRPHDSASSPITLLRRTRSRFKDSFVNSMAPGGITPNGPGNRLLTAMTQRKRDEKKFPQALRSADTIEASPPSQNKSVMGSPLHRTSSSTRILLGRRKDKGRLVPWST